MRDDYPSFTGFDDVYLEDSYVLDIVVHPGTVTLRLELLLLPSHPSWHPPPAGDRACFRPATIVFPHVRDLHWTELGAVRPAVDVDGTTDYGSVDSLSRDADRYLLLGDWGRIRLESDPPSLSIDSSPPPGAEAPDTGR